MITILGATGFTGRKVAAILDRENIPYRLAGRSLAKLTQLSSILPSHPEIIPADLSQSETLPRLLKHTKVLMNCAGPFTDIGEKVVSLCALHGVHYLDITNELGYVYRLRSYDKIARRRSAALVPSCGFEVALADCAAAYLAKKYSFSHPEIEIVYHLDHVIPSRGTRLSTLRTLATSWLAYENGGWTGRPPGSRRIKVTLDSGGHNAISIPSSESVTLLCHLSPRSVSTWMTVSPINAFLSQFLLPIFSSFLRSFPGRSVLWATGLQPSAHDESPSAFEIQLSFLEGKRKETLNIFGHNPYHLTAEIAALAAAKMQDPYFHRAGVNAPSQIIHPGHLFTKAKTWGVHTNPEIEVNDLNE